MYHWAVTTRCYSGDYVLTSSAILHPLSFYVARTVFAIRIWVAELTVSSQTEREHPTTRRYQSQRVIPLIYKQEMELGIVQ